MHRLALGLGLIALLAPSADAADLDARAARVAELRAEVEGLNTEVGLARDALTTDLRAAAGQAAELEAAARRQELRLERLLRDEQVAQQQVEAQARTTGDDLVEVVRAALAALDDHVATGLPFQVDGRREALGALRRHLDARTLPTEQVAARVWAFAEDERRLTRENALGRQVATLDGREVLVDVARLGMVAMYFRTPDDTVGQVRRTPSGWTWTRLDTDTETAQVHALFDALERGIRTGWFELPQPLAGLETAP